jgi:hypothetical protein
MHAASSCTIIRALEVVTVAAIEPRLTGCSKMTSGKAAASEEANRTPFSTLSL